jgi:hypothetical protein
MQRKRKEKREQKSRDHMTENMQIRENVNTGNMGECYQKFL